MGRPPSRFGVGVAWKHESLTVLADCNRVNYSELTDDPAILGIALVDEAEGILAGQTDDGNEVRIGVEWRLPDVGRLVYSCAAVFGWTRTTAGV